MRAMQATSSEVTATFCMPHNFCQADSHIDLTPLNGGQGIAVQQTLCAANPVSLYQPNVHGFDTSQLWSRRFLFIHGRDACSDNGQHFSDVQLHMMSLCMSSQCAAKAKLM